MFRDHRTDYRTDNTCKFSQICNIVNPDLPKGRLPENARCASAAGGELPCRLAAPSLHGSAGLCREKTMVANLSHNSEHHDFCSWRSIHLCRTADSRASLVVHSLWQSANSSQARQSSHCSISTFTPRSVANMPKGFRRITENAFPESDCPLSRRAPMEASYQNRICVTHPLPSLRRRKTVAHFPKHCA